MPSVRDPRFAAAALKAARRSGLAQHDDGSWCWLESWLPRDSIICPRRGAGAFAAARALGRHVLTEVMPAAALSSQRCVFPSTL